MKTRSQVVVITGASAGVGRATARMFAQQGAKVALLARGVDGLEGARAEVERAGGTALAISVDVADNDAVEAAAARIEEELGPIDVWVNNAMASIFAPFMQITPEEFRRVTDVTYLGAVHGTMAALKRMLPRDSGTIVQVGSALAYRSIPLQSAYCGAKAAMRGFTDSIRTELGHDRSHVRMSMVQMPALNTPQFAWTRSRMRKKSQPVPPIFQPDVAARAIVYAAEHAPREMYVAWPAVKAIVFGAQLGPGVGDMVLSKMGYEAQMTDEDRDPRAPDNLFEPVPGDHGTRGSFDRVATSRSPVLWSRMHRFGIGLALASLAGGFAMAALHRRMR